MENGVTPPSPLPSAAAAAVATKRRLSDHEAAAKIQAGFRGFKVRQQKNPKEAKKHKEEEEVVDIDLADPSVNKAALLIQNKTKNMAGLKALRAKKAPLAERSSSPTRSRSPTSSHMPHKSISATKQAPMAEDEAAVKKSMNKPQLTETEQQAATRIQAQFKGYQARKNLKRKKDAV